jgi:hypothetical protein
LRVLDQKEWKTRRQTVQMYKIQWSHHTEEEATWETEDYLNTNLETVSSPPRLIILKSNLGTRFRLRRVGYDAPGF